jgi:tRNA (mo5U34)-methyltransferase|tara:strand:+ start:255 stop:920 length:666 start_codon:yes stop_codon:yes gene_type:complete
MTAEEKKQLVESNPHWWHNMDFGDGVNSGGPDPAEHKAKLWRLDLIPFKDKTVLDIGAWDGYFSFYAERKGAKEVTALDISAKKGFNIAKQIFDSKVNYVIRDVMETTPENTGIFDIVLYPGVLYHMKFPYLSLHLVADLVKEGGTLFVETHVSYFPDQDQLGRPMPLMAFYPNKELNNDPTNWWGPNNTCVIQMLQSLGFRVEKVVPSNGDRMAYHAVKK